MAEPSPRPMGWQVPGRLPAVVAAATLALLVVLVALAGWTYRRTVGAQRRQPVHAFPAPGIETYVHDGQGDPPRPRPPAPADPAIAAAKHAVVTQGLPGWPR